jgi:hypothetical protein
MTSMSFQASKRVRAHLSRLASIAHERELGAKLRDLSLSFDRWRNGDLNSWDLDNAVHRFITGPERRQLFNRYNSKNIAHMMVAQAIVRGILRPDEIPDDVSSALQEAIAFYQRGLADGSISFDEED